METAIMFDDKELGSRRLEPRREGWVAMATPPEWQVPSRRKELKPGT